MSKKSEQEVRSEYMQLHGYAVDPREVNKGDRVILIGGESWAVLNWLASATGEIRVSIGLDEVTEEGGTRRMLFAVAHPENGVYLCTGESEIPWESVIGHIRAKELAQVPTKSKKAKKGKVVPGPVLVLVPLPPEELKEPERMPLASPALVSAGVGADDAGEPSDLGKWLEPESYLPPGESGLEVQTEFPEMLPSEEEARVIVRECRAAWEMKQEEQEEAVRVAKEFAAPAARAKKETIKAWGALVDAKKLLAKVKRAGR